MSAKIFATLFLSVVGLATRARYRCYMYIFTNVLKWGFSSLRSNSSQVGQGGVRGVPPDRLHPIQADDGRKRRGSHRQGVFQDNDDAPDQAVLVRVHHDDAGAVLSHDRVRQPWKHIWILLERSTVSYRDRLQLHTIQGRREVLQGRVFADVQVATEEAADTSEVLVSYRIR